jgi:hypothetical protein
MRCKGMLPERIIKKIANEIFLSCELVYYRFFYKQRRIRSLEKKRFFITDDPTMLGKKFRELFPERVDQKIAEAERICEHVFDLLGSGPMQWNKILVPGYQAIDWRCDFKSGYRWEPQTFYKRIRYGHVEGVDIKVPWELSRFQHLTILGEAYVLTGNEKFAVEFEMQISDWIDNNPVGFGVNWSCTMDVAIRAANWLVAMEFFTGRAFLNTFMEKFYSSIYEHGRFIRSHLEYSSVFTNNHYLADLSGLLFIGLYCRCSKESKGWARFAISELNKEILKQVYPDGCSFEASTCYHRLALELLFYSKLIAERAGFCFDKSFDDRLRTMFEFSLYCIKPNGTIPQIGDNDNGRFLSFSKRGVLDNRYLLSLAAIYYKDDNFKLPEFEYDEEVLWIFGADGFSVFDQLPLRGKPIESRAFVDAGWYIIRHEDNYCFISCGPNGQNGKGGHAHNDKLSFELMLKGVDVIVDPGTYAYTSLPAVRDEYRSVGYHNTVKSDRYEQNKFKAIFFLPNEVIISKACLEESGTRTVFRGEIEYGTVSHKRMIALDKQSCSWIVEDRVCSSESQSFRIAIHLSPAVTCRNNLIVAKRDGDVIADIDAGGRELEDVKYYYSPEYGIRMESECLYLSVLSGGQTARVNINANCSKP